MPADGRILTNASLKIDESALTGESLAVEKSEDTITGEVPLGDQTNMVFSGSFVTYGRGSFLVTAIGMDTEVGKIATLLKTTSEKKTPLQMNLDEFGKKLSVVILIFCGILFWCKCISGSQHRRFLYVCSSTGCCSDSGGTQLYRDNRVIIWHTEDGKRACNYTVDYQAVEGLGSVSIICSDKTGTLTQNRMTVEDYYVNGKRIPAAEIDRQALGQKELLRYSILCNDSTNVDGVEIGDPTETALINTKNNGAWRRKQAM